MVYFKLLFYIIFIIVIALIAIRIYKKKEKLELKGFYLALIALIISIVPFVETVFDLIPHKPLDIISVTPVCIYKEFKGVKLKPQPYEIGCYLIAEIKNQSKDSYISSFQISGNLRVKETDCLILLIDTEKNYDSIVEKIPYYSIAWSTWPYKNSFPIKLEANSRQYVIFTLWDPILNGQRDYGWSVPVEDYFGYKKGDISPKRVNAKSSAQDFLEITGWYNIQGINKNLIDKEINFIITVNGTPEKFDMNLLKAPVVLSIEDWENKPLEKILLCEDRLIKQ